MPIYEFKCTNCGGYNEFLLLNAEEKIKFKCSSCNSRELERIISKTNYSISGDSNNTNNKNSCASTETRACSGGSCTTYNIPGEV